MTTCLQHLELSGNLTAVREMSGISLKIREMSGKGNVTEKILSGKSCLKLFIVSCIFASIQVFSRSLFCVKYSIWFQIMHCCIPSPPLTVTVVLQA